MSEYRLIFSRVNNPIQVRSFLALIQIQSLIADKIYFQKLYNDHVDDTIYNTNRLQRKPRKIVRNDKPN
ncbi:hypothetical protein YC2023_049977 [Brassica napus]